MAQERKGIDKKTKKVKAEKVTKLILLIFSSKHSECVEFHRAVFFRLCQYCTLFEWEPTIVF